MRAGASLVLTEDPHEAAVRGAAGAAETLGGASPSLAVLFASPHFLDRAPYLVAEVRREIGEVPLVGCVAESVVGGPHEIEDTPAVSLWLGAGLGAVETFEMEFVRTPSGGAFSGYRFDHQGEGAYLMICDPFTFPADDLLRHLNEHAPGTQVVGGMASGGLQARRSRLFLNGGVRSSGAVGVHLPGVEVHPLVSQGCRPVGSPFTVTRAEGNLIQELGGQPPLERIEELAAVLPERDRSLLGVGVHVGRVIDEYCEHPGRGDFLIRGVIGADRSTGAIAVGDEVQVGQTIQFHVRDADSADEDLRKTLERELGALGGRRPEAALLFTCNGRGSRMFSEPDHDARLVAEMLGGAPLAGFFCAGELGPVGGRNFLHGFTASIAVFPQTSSAS